MAERRLWRTPEERELIESLARSAGHSVDDYSEQQINNILRQARQIGELPAECVMTAKAYLGDAVYAAIDEWGRLVLTTEDGYRATNTIVLEPEVLAALDRWRRAIAAEIP